MVSVIRKLLLSSLFWFVSILIVTWGVQWSFVERIASNNAKIQTQIELMPQIDKYTKDVLFYVKTIRKYLNHPDSETKNDITHLSSELYRQGNPHRYFGPNTPEEKFYVANYFRFDELVRSEFHDFENEIEAGEPLDEEKLNEFYKRMDYWENYTPISIKEKQILVTNHFLASNRSCSWWIRGLNIFMAALVIGYYLRNCRTTTDPKLSAQNEPSSPA